MLRYDFPFAISGRFALRSLPDTWIAPSVRVPQCGSTVGRSNTPAARALLSRLPRTPALVPGTKGPHKFSEPPLWMHAPHFDPGGVAGTWSLVPETAAFRHTETVGFINHNNRYFGAQQRSLHPCSTRPRTPPYDDARELRCWPADQALARWDLGIIPHPLGSNNQFHGFSAYAILQFQGFGFNLSRPCPPLGTQT